MARVFISEHVAHFKKNVLDQFEGERRGCNPAKSVTTSVYIYTHTHIHKIPEVCQTCLSANLEMNATRSEMNKATSELLFALGLALRVSIKHNAQASISLGSKVRTIMLADISTYE